MGIKHRIKQRFDNKEDAIRHQLNTRAELISKIPDEQTHIECLIRRYKDGKLSLRERKEMFDYLVAEHERNKSNYN